jgi:hypothetical protein
MTTDIADEKVVELGVPDRLPKNFMELVHRRIVNQEGQPLIVLNGYVYWGGSGRMIGPVAILKPTCPKEYYFCDYCGGSFTQKFSAAEGEMSLAKHFEESHRDIVLRTMPQPKNSAAGSWAPSELAVHSAAEKLAGVVPEIKDKDPNLVIKPVASLASANKRPAKKWKEPGSETVVEE